MFTMDLKSKEQQNNLRTAYNVICEQYRLFHSAKSKDIVIKLTDGFILVEQPKIEKNFCFGYSDSAYNNDSLNNASRCAATARTSEDYFIQENLEHFNRQIESVKEHRNWWYISNLYIDYANKGDKIKYFKNYRYVQEWQKLEHDRKATDDEINLYIEALEMAKSVLLKRLQTYLKKYGLSKVRSWTYWQDA